MTVLPLVAAVGLLTPASVPHVLAGNHAFGARTAAANVVAAALYGASRSGPGAFRPARRHCSASPSSSRRPRPPASR